MHISVSLVPQYASLGIKDKRLSVNAHDLPSAHTLPNLEIPSRVIPAGNANRPFEFGLHTLTHSHNELAVIQIRISRISTERNGMCFYLIVKHIFRTSINIRKGFIAGFLS